MIRVFVPRDSAARSVGADDVAAALVQHLPAATLIRTGSRGLLWLEPLVEVETPAGRHAFGPVTAADIPGLLDALAAPAEHRSHPLALGPVDELDWLRRQTRYTCARLGVIDPLSLEDYLAHDGYDGLGVALTQAPERVCADITESGLRGRGGAGFPTGRKWDTVRTAPADVKFICANADEGDSGTFADRMLMEGDPFSLIEGMTIAAHAVGAREGFIYVRSEYPDAVAVLSAALDSARAHGYLGSGIQGSNLTFDISVRVGAGAYICGEETAMLESIEGRRGQVRAKPPIPALVGLFGRPTVVNNVLTLCTVPVILARGPQSYAALGVDRSRGTQVFQLGGNVARGGLVETPFGQTLGDLVKGFGGGTRSGRPVRAVQVGGPLGAYLPTTQFDLSLDYETFAAADAMLGHGGIVVFDDTVDLSAQARFAMEFCATESCGKCTPCRIGSVRGVEVLDAIRAGVDRERHLTLLDSLCSTMTHGSLCAMGGLTPMPVQSAIRHFPEDFDGPPPTGAPPRTGEPPPTDAPPRTGALPPTGELPATSGPPPRNQKEGVR